MSGTNHDLVGKPVSEAEVAQGLGFKNLDEFHRWQTDLGRENSELKHETRQALQYANGLIWHLKRQEAVLLKCREFVLDVIRVDEIKEGDDGYETCQNLILGIDVARGKGVDWDHKVRDWFKDC